MADGDVEACSNVFHCLIALGDNTHTLSNGFGCDWVITSDHNNLEYDRKRKMKMYEMKGKENDTKYRNKRREEIQIEIEKNRRNRMSKKK